jgi:predicted RNA-binding Zn-ribbon protein involved in translation (DUF1610 family)
MAKEICQDCGCIFEPKSQKGMICPKCHRQRLSRYAKERELNKLGNVAYSKQQANRRAEDGK